MYNLIPPFIILLSLGGILFLFLRKIYGVSEKGKNSGAGEDEEDFSLEIGAFKKDDDYKREEVFSGAADEQNNEHQNKNVWVSKVREVGTKIKSKFDFERLKFLTFQFLEKFLRKTKVNLMKIENLAADLTKKLSAKARDLNPDIPPSNRVEKNDIIEKMEDEKVNNVSEPIVSVSKESIVRTSTIERPQRKIFRRPKLPRVISRRKEENIHEVVTNRDFVEQEKEFIYRIAKNPADIESYIALGNLYLGVKNYDDARQSFEHALKIDPFNRKARVGIRKIEQKGSDDVLWG